MDNLLAFELDKPKCNPRLLLDSGPPRALYRVNPRLIFGKTWWDEVRQWAYKKYNNSCAACGKQRTKLEAHEMYEVNKKTGKVTIKDIVPLCWKCHSFIHQDLHRTMLQRSEIKASDITAVLLHGRTILKKYKIRYCKKDPNDCQIKYEDWRLVLNGIEYGPVNGNVNGK